MKKVVMMSTYVVALMLSAFCKANSTTASTASVDLSSAGVGHIVQGSSEVLAAGSPLMITSVQTAGDFLVLTVQTTTNMTTAAIKVSRQFSGDFALSTGQLIQSTSTASGYLLNQGGKLLAFVPNEAGKALLFTNTI